ncbi:MAG: EamA family transporter [Anaerolineales bacterium]|jgi:drug/metabolite transporter (DMT)-like permease|nr:EamA family transporter [Anaerolineales bacterium]
MKTKVWAAMLAIYIIWGSTYLAIRFTIESIPPFLQAGMRFFISAIVILGWRFLAGDERPTLAQWRDASIVGLFLLVGGNGLVSWAEQTVDSGIAALIVGTVPIWLTLFEALRPGGVKPGWPAILGLMVGFGGIFILLNPATLASAAFRVDLWGAGALVLATIFWATGSIYSKSAQVPKSAVLFTGMQMASASIGLFLVSALSGEMSGFDIRAVTLTSWLGLLYLIIFGSLIAFVAYGWLLRNAPISLVSTYGYVNPVVAMFLGAWLADEILTGRVFVAAAVIVSAVVLINQSKSAKRQPTA